MLRSTLGLGLAAALTLSVPAAPLPAQDADLVASTDPWTREELENLLAPIALYPDPILAQVLVAATYPDQVLAAQAHVRAFGQNNIDIQPWELSVKAVARYEPVLNLMAEGEDWMVALGQAYATQPVDVMTAVQSLRQMANAQGNLVSTPQQQVVVEREVIRIVPAQPQVIYVPTYDPAVVYFRPIYVARAHPAYWHWGAAYPIGVWLTYDFDWWSHRVYYHGWHAGPHWVVVSRPFIVINPIYVSPRYTTVVVNRRVVNRRFDGRRLDKYRVVHRGTTFDRRGNGPDRRGVAKGGRDDDRGRGGPPNGAPRGNNGNRGLGPDRGNDGNRGVGPRGSAPRASDVREDRRVVPIPSGATRRTGLTPDRGADTRESARDALRRVPSAAPTTAASPDRSSRDVLRQSNGTWNPRASRSTPSPTTGAAPGRSPREVLGGSSDRRPSAVAPGASTTAPRGSAQPPRSSRGVIGGAAERRPTASPSGSARPSAPPRSPSARPSSPSRAPTARPSRAPSSSRPAASPRSGGSARGAVSGARSSGGSRGSASRGGGGGRRGGGGGEE